MKRALFDFLLFLSVLFLPWWINTPLAFLGLFLFKNYYEYLAFSVVVFVLYRTSEVGATSSPVYFSLIVVLSYILIQFIKERLIFYKK